MSDADRAARIEQLLLSGLDHYFGGDYEQAIHVWTRVAFLERGHGRARAYIERARSALAERQRESEEHVEKGIAAYEAGDLQTARELLTRAVDEGGANETALAFLQRLGRADAVADAPRAQRAAAGASRRGTHEQPARRQWIATTLASTVVVLVIIVAALGAASWLRESPAGVRAGEAAPPDPLPIVRDAELRIGRAQQLHASGQPLAALKELDAVDSGDVLRAEADRVKADIQRTLLSTALETGPRSVELAR